MKKLLYISMMVSSLLVADSDVEQLKKQMNEQQLMIQKLLSKIESLEQKSTKNEKSILDNITAQKSDESVQKDEIQTKSKTFSQVSYMPDISLIGDISYVSRNKKDDELPHLELPGVAHGIMGSHSHDGNSHSPYNAGKGFNLNYAELMLSKSVDPTLNLDGIFHFSEGGVEIEELYFTTTALGYGSRIKGGKFNSNFGYLNDQHHHAWSFADMPLVYEAFLGMHGINEKGLQFQWTAPTSNYLMIGAEVLQGENEQMFGNQSIHLNDLNASNPHVDSENAPSMYVGYVKTSFDIGDTTILGGLSYAKGSARIDHSEEEEEAHAISGDSTLYGADLTVKHYFDSYSFLTWQSELLSRKIKGTLYEIDDTTKFATSSDLTKKQTGLYTQLVYAPNQSWKMGVRYDTIFKNNINGTDSIDDFKKYSAMLEYNTSEFAKFRLQYNRNRALYNEDGQKQNINSVILQANFSIGAHGAHSF